MLTNTTLSEHDQAHSCLPDGNQSIRALTRCKNANILLHVGNAEASSFHWLDVARIIINHIPGPKKIR